jgi:LuxR family quorum-sensing system transcriptional regulator CciR
MKGLLRLVEQFDDRMATALTMDDVTGETEAAIRELGFYWFAIIHHLSLRASAPHLIESTNYPDALKEIHIGKGLFVRDPVLMANQHAFRPFLWIDVHRFVPPDPLHDFIFRCSRRAGVGEGITVPAHVPGEPNGSCSFATRTGRPLPKRRILLAVELVAALAFERGRELQGYPRSQTAAPHLSPREMDCLRLLVGGASDKMIARKLGLSPDTAAGYVKTARGAYGTRSRTDLVVRALRDGLVSYDDAIPQH